MQQIPDAVVYEICQFIEPVSLQKAIRANSQFFRATKQPRFWFDYYNSFFQVPEPVPVADCLNGTHNFFQLFKSRFLLYYDLYCMRILPFQHKSMVSFSNMKKSATQLRKLSFHCERLAYQMEALDAITGDVSNWQYFASEPQNLVIHKMQRFTDMQYDGAQTLEFAIKIYDTRGIGNVDMVVFSASDNESSHRFEINGIELDATDESGLDALVPLAQAWNVPKHCSLMQFVGFLDKILEQLNLSLETRWSLYEGEFFETFGHFNAHMEEMSKQKIAFFKKRTQDASCDGAFFDALDDEWQMKTTIDAKPQINK